MKVNIKQISQPLHISAKLDLTELKWFGEYPIKTPVEVEAVFSSQNDIITLNYTANFAMQGPCSRCLEPVDLPVKLSISHILVEKLEDEKNDDFILVSDGYLLLDELVKADICLEFDGVLLCDENCKGLCSSCGVNHNLKVCSCKTHTHDPRFDKLLEFIDIN